MIRMLFLTTVAIVGIACLANVALADHRGRCGLFGLRQARAKNGNGNELGRDNREFMGRTRFFDGDGRPLRKS